MRGSPFSITAIIHSVRDVTSVLWYRNGTLLELESDERYTASTDSTMATLRINNFGDEDVGRYVVVVTSNGSVANASVEVMYLGELTTGATPILSIQTESENDCFLYLVLASAAVSVRRQTVDVGERVEVLCSAEGSGPLTTGQWGGVVRTYFDPTVVSDIRILTS